MVHVDTESFFVIVLVSALAAVTVATLPARFAAPVVVMELAFGILIGPHALSIAATDEFTELFSNLGLGMLFFSRATGSTSGGSGASRWPSGSGDG